MSAPKITIVNETDSPITLITGEEIQPNKPTEIDMATFNENKPWINGSGIKPVEVDPKTGFGTARQVKGSATTKA